jgi:4-hydroxybenzoate polyprenyltransferase
MIKDIIISIRPYQWVKNILVFAALFFSLSFFQFDAIILSIHAFVTFCLISSSIYLLNDIRDRKEDLLHPFKKNRPIATGRISMRTAMIFFFVLLIAGVLLAFFLNIKFLLLVVFYLFINIGYSFGLKRIVILDIMIVATGFLIRALAGAVAIDVDASPWLFICTLLLALLIVIGKRRNELFILKSGAVSHRTSLTEYSIPFLDGLMFVSASGAIVTYALYTIAEETIKRFETRWLIATTPVVIYSIFRYLYLIYIKQEGGDPTKMILKDKAFIISGLLWIIMIGVIIYFVRFQ